MAKIGLDVDGNAYKFVDAFRNNLIQLDGRTAEELPPAEDWNFFKTWGYSTAEYMNMVVKCVTEGDLFWKGDMYPDCKEVVEYLYDLGHEITFITSRFYPGIDEICSEATFHWFDNEAMLPYDNIIITEDKSGYGLDVLFDDAPHQVERNIIAGEKAVIVDQLWNQHMTYPQRVTGWLGILDYVEEYFPIRNRNATKTVLTS